MVRGFYLDGQRLGSRRARLQDGSKRGFSTRQRARSHRSEREEKAPAGSGRNDRLLWLAEGWVLSGGNPHPTKAEGAAPREFARAARSTPMRLEHLAEDVLEDAAVFVVVDFFGGVNAGDDGEFLLGCRRGTLR